MPKSKKPVPKRALASTLEASISPPSQLSPHQTIARVLKGEGNHLHSVVFPAEAQERLALGPGVGPEVGFRPGVPLGSGKEGSDKRSSGGGGGGGGGDDDALDATNTTAVTSDGGGGYHLVELMSALRSTVFLRRGGYVLVDCDGELRGGRENKIVGIIVGVVLGGKTEREWRKMGYWPEEFGEGKAWDESGSDADDWGPKMPEISDDNDDDDDEQEEGQVTGVHGVR